MRAAVLALAVAVACGNDDLTPIPGTTTRVAKATVEPRADLALRIHTTVSDCRAVGVTDDLLAACLPRVDRAHGEVRLSYHFEQQSGAREAMPNDRDHLKVVHQGTEVMDGANEQRYTVVPHDPQDARQLYVLVLDGSSSMLEGGRFEQLRQALLLPEVASAFFPDGVRTGVTVLQFTEGQPRPLTGKVEIFYDKRSYAQAIRGMNVLSGYTHLYDAVKFATGPFLRDPEIERALTMDDMAVTVVALTDGFNNLRAADTCRDNAARLGPLLRHLRDVREDTNSKRRPTVYTVGLGRPIRRDFAPPPDSIEVDAQTLCGPKAVDRRIDGDLERLGIDNASLAWIAEVGGGDTFVRNGRDGLGQAFQGAAARRYGWFELRYQLPPFYLRRAFTTRLRLTAPTADASVRVVPSAWMDGPPGQLDADGWAGPASPLATLGVLVPFLGLFVALGHLGAAAFNTRRALMGRVRPGAKAVPRAPGG